MALILLHLADMDRGRAVDLDLVIDIDLGDLYMGVTKKVVVNVYDEYGQKRRVTLFLDLSDRRDVYVFSGMGDASLFRSSHIQNGDVLITVNVKPHPLFTTDPVGIDSSDLYITFNVTVFDYYYGKIIRFLHLDGEMLSVEYRRNTHDDKSGDYINDNGNNSNSGDEDDGRVVCMLPDKGLLNLVDDNDAQQRGTLYVFFNLTLPALCSKHLNNPMIMATLALLFSDRNHATWKSRM